jgi:predicted NUDIX family NTP pyrophosphohydrolase
MVKKSAGILLYRFRDGHLEVLLGHPGGPYHAKKDLGAWSIPKGEFDDNEEPIVAAKREFFEETGFEITGEPLSLIPIKQKGGKMVYAWAVEQDIDAAKIKSNTFLMEYPPYSGNQKEFPELDRAEWFPVPAALEKINPAQAALIKYLIKRLESKE